MSRRYRVVTLHNDYHGTTAPLFVPEFGVISPAAERRLRKKLCGRKGCECAGYGGIRGSVWSLRPMYTWATLTGFLFGRPWNS